MSPSEHDEHEEASLVVGVALPVPEPWGSHLQRLRIGYGEERAAAIPTHITLLPPTPCTAQELEALEAHLLSDTLYASLLKIADAHANLADPRALTPAPRGLADHHRHHYHHMII